MSKFCLSPRQPVFPFVWHMKARLSMLILNAAIPKNSRLFRYLIISIL